MTTETPITSLYSSYQWRNQTANVSVANNGVSQRPSYKNGFGAHLGLGEQFSRKFLVAQP